MRPSASDTSLTGFERSLAVVIGINSYSHGIPPLHTAVSDANSVADTLERQGFEVLRLLDSQATLSALSHLLSHHLPSLPTPPDRLLIYFAGHGLAHTDGEHQLSGFLLPSDARRDDLSSYWPMASLREALRHLPCRHLLLILDCCFAGAFPHPPSRDIRAPSQPAPLYLERFRHFSSRRSFQLLLSTAHDELASDRLLAKPLQESLGDGLHSPFTVALLQALKPSSPADSNQDGLLTAAELYTFLRDRLLSLVPAHCQQTPSLWHLDWHDGGEFLFLLSDAFPSLPPAAPLSQHSNPYLGLRSFSSAQRHLFFGRERLVDSLLERLRAQPLLLLCGPSGAGKSSLVHAGLLPRLTEEPSWRVPPSLRPSSQPLHALSVWLASLAPGTAPPSAAVLASRPRSAAEFLGSFLARHPERSVLLVIDPLEELVTSCLNDSVRRAFLRALSGLLHLSHPRLHLLLLLRSDFEPHFLSQLQPSAFPSGLWHGGRLNLPPMNRDELRQCIEKPAEACVLFFSPGLIERLLDDVEQMPGALPLLSVALSELFGAYLASGRDDRTLDFEDYHHIGGGIAGALQCRAELVFSGTPPPSPEGQPPLPAVPPQELPAFQRTLRNVLLRMVSPEGGELARRRVSRSELEYPHREENDRVQRALRTLEASRLVVASDDGGPCVEPAHDALLSAWPRLHDWARHAQRELLLLRRVSHAASEWHRHHHPPDFLWADARLDQLGLEPTSLRRTNVPLALPTASPGSQTTEPLALNAAESTFLRTSATRRRFLRTRRYALALTVAISLVALTVAALFQADKANGNAREAKHQQRIAEDNARKARHQEDAAEANAREALRQQKLADLNAREAQRQQEAAEANAQEARKQQEAAEASFREAQRQQAVAEANAQEARKQQQLAAANAREALSQRNTSEANARKAREQQEAAEANAREAHEQQEAAEANAREAQKQREAAEAHAREAQRQRETAEVNAREALNQQQIADSNATEALSQRNTAEAHAMEARKQQQAADTSAREARKQKDRALASTRLTQAERLIEEDPTKALLVLLEVSSQTESPNSSWLHTALEISQRAITSTILAGHDGTIIDMQFSRDGSRVLTASDDGTTRIWRSDGSGSPLVLAGSSATFSPDGSRVLTVSDGIARVWHSDGSGTPIGFTGYTGAVTSATFSPDGSLVLTVSDDGTARVWRSDGSSTPVIFTDPTNAVMSATFSPDGSHILTVSEGTARIWRADGSGPPVVLESNTDSVLSASFSPDSSRVLTISRNRVYWTARIWRADGSGTPINLTDPTGSVTTATFSPDGSLILTGHGDGTARIWRADGSGMPIGLPGHTGWVTSATFSPDGSLILTASNDGTARIWQTTVPTTSIYFPRPNVKSATTSRADGTTAPTDPSFGAWLPYGAGTPIVLTGHTNSVTSATFSPDGAHVLTASDDGTARIWRSTGSGTRIVFDSQTDPLTSTTFSPDGSLALTASNDGTLRIWRSDGSGTPLVLTGHSGWVTSATFSPDGSLVLITDDDGTLRIWRSDGSGTPLVLTGHTSSVTSATFSPDGSLVLTTSYDGTARIWRSDGVDTPLVLTHPIGAILSATFSPDGSRVLTAHEDGTARIWRSHGADMPIVFTDPSHLGSLASATFSPDGSLILTTFYDGTAHIWRSDGASTPIVLTSHTGAVTSATFSPDGSRVLTVSDGIARIWRSDGSGTPIDLTGHTGAVTSATFSPDGSRILTASDDGTARIWRSDGSGTPIILTGHLDTVVSASFSSDGAVVLTTSNDGTARIWRVDEQTPPLILRHEERSGAFFEAFMLPDGSRVITLSTDGLARIWPITPDLLRSSLRKASTVCLSVNERERYLFESLDEAREGHEGCEQSHGRQP